MKGHPRLEGSHGRQGMGLLVTTPGRLLQEAYGTEGTVLGGKLTFLRKYLCFAIDGVGCIKRNVLEREKNTAVRKPPL